MLHKKIYNLYSKFFYFILFIRRIPTPATEGLVRINAKERNEKERQGRRAKKKKGIGAQRVKHLTPTRAIDALIGEEKQKKKNRDLAPQPSCPEHSGHLLQPAGITQLPYSFNPLPSPTHKRYNYIT